MGVAQAANGGRLSNTPKHFTEHECFMTINEASPTSTIRLVELTRLSVCVLYENAVPSPTGNWREVCNDYEIRLRAKVHAMNSIRGGEIPPLKRRTDHDDDLIT